MTRPADLTSQMQLLAAYALDPGFRPELGDQLAALGPMIAGQLEANAAAVFEREAARLFGGNGARFNPIPTASDISATKLEDLTALLKSELAGPADVTMVGDIDAETAIAAMRSTFAAGTPGSRPASPTISVTMPDGRDEPYIVTHGGRSDQAFYGLFWSLPDYRSNPRDSYTADVVAAILGARLVDTVREKLGMTYSPRASASTSISLPGQGYLRVSIETPPNNFRTFRDLLNAQLADLASKPITADELERARKPLVEASLKSREDNAWWASNLTDTWREPIVRDWMLEETEQLKSVTAADVQAFTGKMLAARKPTTIIAQSKQ